MSIMKEHSISHHVRNEADTTPQIIFTALRRNFIIKQVKYRYKAPATLPAAFQLMQLADGENVTLGRPYYLDRGAPLHDLAGYYALGQPLANQVVTIPDKWLPDGPYATATPSPVWRLGRKLPVGYSLGLFFSGKLAGLEDLDITVTLLPVDQLPIG